MMNVGTLLNNTIEDMEVKLAIDALADLDHDTRLIIIIKVKNIEFSPQTLEY